MPKGQEQEFVEVTIAVPITLSIHVENVGYFLGPCYLYRARFGGTFNMRDQTGNTPEEAAWKMAERLKGAFNP